MRTFSPKVTEIQRTWYVVDADGLVLGRLASSVAAILRGKHRPYFAPHVDTGDHVIVVNADKVVLTSNKADAKLAYRHSGYPGGLRSTSYAELLEREAGRAHPPLGARHAPEEHAGTPACWASCRSTPAPTTRTRPRSPSRSSCPRPAGAG